MNISFLSPVNFKNTKNNLNSVSNPYFKGNIKTDSFERTQQNKPTYEQLSAYLDIYFEIEDEIRALKEKQTKLSQEEKTLSRMKFRGEFVTKNQINDKWEQIEEIKKEIKKLVLKKEKIIGKINPNVEFLGDDALGWSEKRKIIETRPEIMKLSDIEKANRDGFHKSIWYGGQYLMTNRPNGIQYYVDSSYPANKKNLDILLNENIISKGEFEKKYDIDVIKMNRYIKEGILKQQGLTNLRTGEVESVNLFDVTDETNIKGVERHKNLKSMLPKETKYKAIDFLPIEYISSLGYGSIEEIKNEIINKKLPTQTTTIRTPNGIKETIGLNWKHISAIGTLNFLKNGNSSVISMEEMLKLTKLDITDLEECILSGEVTPIKECLYPKKQEEFEFNTKNAKTREFIEKKQFEYEIKKELLSEERKERASLRAKIAWKLSEETRKASRQVASRMPEIIEIFKKQREIKEINEKIENGEISENEAEKPKISYADRIKIKTYNKYVWEIAGTEEFKYNMQRAKIAVEQLNKDGIHGVKDEEIRYIIVTLNDETSPNQ